MQSGYRPDTFDADPWAEEPVGPAGPAGLISPSLITQFYATPQIVDHLPALELVLGVLRDHDDLIGWQNDLALGLRSDRPGRWMLFSPGVGAYQPLPYGDEAMATVGQYDALAAWRFIPDVAAPHVDIWAYVFVNGIFVPFDELEVSNQYVDVNGAARLRAAL